VFKGHVPVLLNEAISALNVSVGKKYVDCTFGFGGHSLEILRLGGQVMGLDVDDTGYRELTCGLKNKNSEKLDVGSLKLEKEIGSRKLENLRFVRENFRNLDHVLDSLGWDKVDGVLYDLGMSSYQIEESGKGFSYLREESLDMRMDQRLGVTAADLVNSLPEKELYELIKNFGEDLGAYRLARDIVRARKVKLIKTTTDLITAVGLRGFKDRYRIHPATRLFQALRIAVNGELEGLRESLPQAFDHLSKDGRLVVISFHSLEDRIAKNFGHNRQGLMSVGGVTLADDRELAINSRSRSAKMRVFEKL